MTWSTNQKKFAIANNNGYIIIYDKDGNQREKFATKAADNKNTKHTYEITGIDFSPDSTKIAVAQSDSIVFVYRLGSDFGDKKSICNKFMIADSAYVSCIDWPCTRNDSLVFGLSNGRIKIGILQINQQRKNKSAILYDTQSYATCIKSAKNGTSFYTSHTNKSIWQYIFPNAEKNMKAKKILVCQLSFIVNTIEIVWNDDIIVSSVNGNLSVIDHQNGQTKQMLDHCLLSVPKMISCSTIHPSLKNIIYGSLECIFEIFFDAENKQWMKENEEKYAIDNYGIITCLDWSPNGNKLCLSSIYGYLDIYGAYLRKIKYNERMDILYTSDSYIIVCNRFSDDSMHIESNGNHSKIYDISIDDNRYVLCFTDESLIIADMHTKLKSEIIWHTNTAQNKENKPEFIFDSASGLATVYYSNELFIMELGMDDILGSIRTEFNSSHLTSLRIINKSKKLIAYLMDFCSISVMDLDTNTEVCNITHDQKIQWLELNEYGNELLFLDQKRSLHLYRIQTSSDDGSSVTLLSFCNYAQWVPESNVIVAQNRSNLCIWYNIRHLKQVKIVSISGDVEDIQRSNDRTHVCVRDVNGDIIEYQLNETLITFTTALDSNEYKSAVAKLERLQTNIEDSKENTEEINAMWEQMSELALFNNDYEIAQRCFIALGDICRTEYLRELFDNCSENNNFEIQAKLAILNKKLKIAENIYISKMGNVDRAILMYIKVNEWLDAIRICQTCKHPLLNIIKDKYFSYLLNTKQYKRAAEYKIVNKEIESALEIYLKYGFASAALNIIIKYEIPLSQQSIISQLHSLFIEQQKDFLNGGRFYEYLGKIEKAFEIYLEGNCFYKCMELAKKNHSLFNDRVLEIEDKWAKYLFSNGEYENAMHHFIESHNYRMAIRCALANKNFDKALEILSVLDSENINDNEFQHRNESSVDSELQSFYKTIADYFYKECGKYSISERLYFLGGYATDAILMYLYINDYERSHSLGMHYFNDSTEELRNLYISEAQKLEMNGKYEECALILIKANVEVQHAIQIFMKHDCMQVLNEYLRKHEKNMDKKNNIYLLLGNEYKCMKEYKNAEKYFLKITDVENDSDLQGNGWRFAVQMYEECQMIDSALKLCRKFGGMNEYKNMALGYAFSHFQLTSEVNDGQSLNNNTIVNQAIKWFISHGLHDKCVQYLLNFKLFDSAFEVAHMVKEKYENPSSSTMVMDIHFAYAMHLESNGDLSRAEEEFMKGGKTKEAIEMYIHAKRFSDAIRVAQTHEPDIIQQVYKAHGIVCAEDHEFMQAEKWFIKANTIPDIIKMYEENELFADALRVAEEYHASSEIIHRLRMSKEMKVSTNNNQMSDKLTNNESLVMFEKANFLKENGNYEQAVDLLLSIKPNENENVAKIVNIWEEAVNIAMEKALPNLPTIIEVIANNLQELGEYEKAAQYFLDINEHTSAIKCYLKLHQNLKAQQLYKMYHVMDDELWQEITANDNKIRNIEHNKSKEIAVEEQLRSLVENAQYFKAIEILFKNISKLIVSADADFSLFLNLLSMIAIDINRNKKHSKLCQEIFIDFNDDRHQIISKCKSILSQMMSINEQKSAEIENLWFMYHLISNQILCQKYLHAQSSAMAKNEKSVIQTLMKQMSISLLRFSDHIRSDILYYNSGQMCLAVGEDGNAFIFLNHFIDICEAIDEKIEEQIDNNLSSNLDSEMEFDMDYSELIGNNMNMIDMQLPYKQVPNSQIIRQRARDKTNDWVLDMVATLETSLNQKICSFCDQNTFEGNRNCHHCKNAFGDICIVTGLAILQSENIVKCRVCGKSANKMAWNLFADIFKRCPACNESQAPIY